MLYGLIGALIGVILFLAGYYFGLDTADKLTKHNRVYIHPPDEVEEDKIKKLEQEYAKACEAMIGYDADTAYGI